MSWRFAQAYSSANSTAFSNHLSPGIPVSAFANFMRTDELHPRRHQRSARVISAYGHADRFPECRPSTNQRSILRAILLPSMPSVGRTPSTILLASTKWSAAPNSGIQSCSSGGSSPHDISGSSMPMEAPSLLRMNFARAHATATSPPAARWSGSWVVGAGDAACMSLMALRNFCSVKKFPLPTSRMESRASHSASTTCRCCASERMRFVMIVRSRTSIASPEAPLPPSPLILASAARNCSTYSAGSTPQFSRHSSPGSSPSSGSGGVSTVKNSRSMAHKQSERRRAFWMFIISVSMVRALMPMSNAS